MNVKEKLQALLTASNTTTGETDTTLTDAVQRLVDGYGGGSTLLATGTYVGTSITATAQIVIPYVSDKRSILIHLKAPSSSAVSGANFSEFVLVCIRLPSISGGHNGWCMGFGKQKDYDDLQGGAGKDYTENANNTFTTYKPNFNANGIQFGTYRGIGAIGDPIAYEIYNLEGMI